MISLDWVSDYIDIHDQEPYDLARKITEAGINIEAVVTHHISNLVIGEIMEVEDHPDSDHLHVCKVNIGDEKLQIVCGANNVRKGLKVIVAKVGAVLPGDFEIKKSKIRGVESCGMMCAKFELGLEEKTEETYAKGITELGDDAKVGEDPLKYLGVDDTLYELDIHKHRNNDCYYHIGFAYEIASILNRKVKLPESSFKTIKDDVNKDFKLKVDTDKCTYFVAREAVDVKIGESPYFIKKRLAAAGMRAINNVVDISNYVMLEYGQPLHFYDKDRLGDKIVVRDAKDGEVITTLDGKKRELDHNDIVITDGKEAVGIAGVMGGLTTEVEKDTKNILIESAIFDPVSIRNTAQKLDLKSEASIRFGKGLSYEYTEEASKRACYLLEKYAGAKIKSGIVLVDKEDHTEKVLSFYPDEVDKLLGITISEEDMKHELEKLDFPYKLKNHKFEVTIPRRRLDVEANVNDIAEEIGRLYGYNNLVSSLPRVPIRRGEYIGDVKYRKLVSKRLRSLGLTEVKNYTLVSPAMSEKFDYEEKKKVVLPNPMSIDKSIVRTTLIPSLLNVYEYNKDHGVEDVSIYEISKTYFDTDFKEESKICGLMSGNYISNNLQKPLKVDFYLVKGIVENILDYMALSNRYSFEKSNISDLHPGVQADIILDGKRIGIIGKVHPNIEKDDIYVFELSLNSLFGRTSKLKFKEAFKYPSIEKDMAFIVDRNTIAGDIIKDIKKCGNKTLQSVEVFDVYEGENIEKDKKSIAFNLVFNGIDRTLKDEEVMQEFNKIIKKIEEKYNAVLRDK
ncbi:MAG: phenylalanine--tRNA ligase subunit beta [Bacilli bacterium]|nr:phenylalanine--tRNA ligase subunit beta [Bacilli bacterium]